METPVVFLWIIRLLWLKQPCGLVIWSSPLVCVHYHSNFPEEYSFIQTRQLSDNFAIQTWTINCFFSLHLYDIPNYIMLQKCLSFSHGKNNTAVFNILSNEQRQVKCMNFRLLNFHFCCQTNKSTEKIDLTLI